MRVIVGGSRTFTNYLFLKRQLDFLTSRLDKAKLVIVHGGALGADKLADQWAFENLVKCEVHHAAWQEHGKKAGPIRNSEMIESGASAAVFFWDGKSPGTADCVKKARKAGIKVKVYTPNDWGKNENERRTNRAKGKY